MEEKLTIQNGNKKVEKRLKQMKTTEMKGE